MTGRFAAIADIHGNRWALEAVMDDIARRGIAHVVNLGDNLFGPLDIEGAAAMLGRLDLPTVRGNQDREMGFNDLPFRLELPGMMLFHGTPHADDIYLLETVRSEGVTPATGDEISSRLDGVEAPLMLCGHTHIPRIVQCGATLIVNPGSVGLQAYRDETPLLHVMETGSPHARYAILEPAETNWKVDLIALPYDWEAAARLAETNARPDWAYRLRTGRVSK